MADGTAGQTRVVRRSWFVGVFGGAVTMSAAVACDRYYCSGPRIHQGSPLWSSEGFYGEESEIEVPVDAAPWLLRTCDNRTIPPGCALVVDGMEIRVRLELSGQEACDLDAGETVLPDGPAVIQRLVPRDPLPPGAVATLDCGEVEDPTGGYYYYWNQDDGYFDYSYSWGNQGAEPPLRLRIRDSSEPAAAPGELDVLELQYTRGDPYLGCDGQDTLEVKVDFGAQFLREGGYVEVVYPNGEVFQFSRASERGVAVLPASQGPLQFTPVAIDGERGETVEVAAGSIDEEKVYVPSCAVSPEGGTGAAGLLTLTVLGIARRRRRTGEDAR